MTSYVAWVAALGIILCASGCDRDRGARPRRAEQQVPTRAAERHGERHLEARGSREHGNEHEEHGARYDRRLLERLKTRRCEHRAQILECDQCRYEVGAVQLSGALRDKGGQKLIRIGRVSHTMRRAGLDLTGEVAFDEKRIVHISPPIEGVARRVFVTTGDQVRAGAALVRLDSLFLGRLRSGHLQARARLEFARQNHEREQRLFKEQISSAREKLQTGTALQEARIALEAARDQLRLIGVSEKGSGRMTLRAPRAGMVVSKHVVPGEHLTPNKEVLTVADLSVVWVLASVYERDLAGLLQARAAGPLEAQVTVAAFPDRVFPGKVDHVEATMEEATRTVKIRVVVPNEKALLRPGMFAQVEVVLGGAGHALLVPAQAVVGDGAERFVFVEIGEDRFLRRDVRPGQTQGQGLEILEGLEAGEKVVVQGAFLLKSDILRQKMGAGCAD